MPLWHPRHDVAEHWMTTLGETLKLGWPYTNEEGILENTTVQERGLIWNDSYFMRQCVYDDSIDE